MPATLALHVQPHGVGLLLVEFGPLRDTVRPSQLDPFTTDSLGAHHANAELHRLADEPRPRADQLDAQARQVAERVEDGHEEDAAEQEGDAVNEAGLVVDGAQNQQGQEAAEDEPSLGREDEDVALRKGDARTRRYAPVEPAAESLSNEGVRRCVGHGS